VRACTFEADIHCADCARERFGDSLDSDTATDTEGNAPHPVFESDEARQRAKYAARAVTFSASRTIRRTRFRGGPGLACFVRCLRILT
jgi:hypothetical protein